MAYLSLALLGGFEASLDGTPITAFEYDKVRALLSFLAVEAAHPHRREKLAGLLWPERSERNARQNLSQALYKLRRILSDGTITPPFLLVTPQTLQFNPASDYDLDVTTFTGLLAACKIHDHDRLEACPPCMDRYQQAVSLYQGDFLAGFSLSDSPPFEEWSLLNRERFHRLAVEGLRHLVHYFQTFEKYDVALEYAWHQVELDPWQEQAHRQVMRLLALSGQREAALAQYETCRRLLADELGIEPATETRRLYEQIRTEEKFSPRLSSPPAPPPSFLDAAHHPSSAPAPLVARECELAHLEKFLDLALAGQGQMVFVAGGAGRGKTMLMQAFARQAQARYPDLIVTGGNGNAYVGLGDPYLPFREILGQLTGDVETRLAVGAISQESAVRLWNLLPLSIRAILKVGPDLVRTFLPAEPLVKRARTFLPQPDSTDWLVQLESLVSQKNTNPERQAQQQSDLFEQYTQVLIALARHQPLLLLLDDLQWADLASINLLFNLGRQLVGSPILIVGAYRPEEVVASQSGQQHPLEPLVNEFKHHFGAVEVDLSQADGWQFVNAFLDTQPNRLDDAFRQTLYRQTEGHPLFTVELLHGMQERGDLIQDQEGRWLAGATLNWAILPPQVEAIIADRIDRLPEDLQDILTIASVEGEIFTAEVVAQVQAANERKTVRHLSDQLGRKHRLVVAQEIRQVDGQHISLYRFRHNLFQKYLYQQLDPPERVYLHQAVGEALESLYGEQSAQIAVQLARHFQKSKNPEKAIDYLRQAGERAVGMSANDEAIAHFRQALELLETLPDSPKHVQQEIDLQLALAVPYLTTTGYGAPEAGRAYDRAWKLCQQLDETTQLFPVLWSLAVSYGARAEYKTSLEIATRLLSMAEQTEDPVQVALAHWVIGWRLFFGGEFALAKTHLEQAITFYDAQQHQALAFLYGQDFGVGARSVAAWTLWLLGYPDQARRYSQEAMTLAQALSHPMSLAFAQVYAATLHVFCRDSQAAKARAEASIELATRHRILYWLSGGFFCLGWALVEQGRTEAGIANIRQSLVSNQETGAKTCQTFQLGGLAEAYGKTGQVEAGLTTLAEALAVAHRTGEQFYQAEIHRLKGELLQQVTSQEQKDEWGDSSPEDCFLKAIEIARVQQAKSLELRATVSLARLWQSQGKQEKARQMLAEIYGWFSEGFDTADLKEAKALLEELSI